ncbi:hypothetical protein V8C34DRAFT_296783 [Trichoderma compactum]
MIQVGSHLRHLLRGPMAGMCIHVLLVCWSYLECLTKTIQPIQKRHNTGQHQNGQGRKATGRPQMRRSMRSGINRPHLRVEKEMAIRLILGSLRCCSCLISDCGLST